ncbi:MAG: ABC-F family ATP-binding cassette domain-containing protein [Gemmatales bacterium]|nr:ABC-F family ATP-binding cassette domain-containing protein [Gemmatales bacterium]MDW8387724.1 ABC-F family ATP-binding cassette domain-containing protein [Gemmatales bacterium]
MLLLTCSELTRGFQQGPLFEDVGFELYHGDRVGLVGPNGVGKTTLLRILAGLDEPDRGQVTLHAGARIGILEQEPRFDGEHTLFHEARSALDSLIQAHEEMVRVGEWLSQATDEAEKKRLTDRFDRLNELLRRHDAYNLDHQVEAVLQGLGFDPKDFDRPIATFSGGQRHRLMLAKLLLAAPDVLLLDEPSNHLDLAGTQWLEEYLGKQNEAMILVSHDRCFLDRVANRIFELHNRKLTAYVGNYSAYVRQREERYQVQLRTWEAQQEYIAKQEDYIRRVHYGELHKQAASRRHALERLERVERPVPIEKPHMHFQTVRRSGDVVFEVRDLAKSYDRPLFSELTLQIRRGQRVGILGPNGSGKTTLLRILLGEEMPDSGQVVRGYHLDVGYFDQHLESLPAEADALRAVWPDDPEVQEQEMRNLLARFGITGDRVYQRVGSMSGGEKSRVALARLVARKINVLILDEPTNHLDLWACEALEEALREFEGTVIVVSHDRWFLNRVVDLLIVLDGKGRAQVIHGNYETYERMRQSEAVSASTGQDRSPRRSAAAPPTDRPARRKRRFPYRKLEDLEAEIAEQEDRMRQLEAALADPTLYRDGDKVKQTLQDFEAAKQRIAQLYEHWEEAVELDGR